MLSHTKLCKATECSGCRASYSSLPCGAVNRLLIRLKTAATRNPTRAACIKAAKVNSKKSL